MCARHDPLLPLLIVLSKLSAGRTLVDTVDPMIPLIHVTPMSLRAVARVMTSRRSVRSGRFMTNTFSNW